MWDYQETHQNQPSEIASSPFCPFLVLLLEGMLVHVVKPADDFIDRGLNLDHLSGVEVVSDPVDGGDHATGEVVRQHGGDSRVVPLTSNQDANRRASESREFIEIVASLPD